jgi:hypothetical protein|tara:strand:+ start:208 stop:681 length:474 start_codon:yes stop_codon:yes gene_type:complete
MNNIKKLETQEQFDLLEDNIDNILSDNVYHDRDWNDDEIKTFVAQFNSFQEDANEALIDMDKLDPNFVSETEYKQKFSGFDDDTLAYMCDLENRKLEDARIPPLIIRNESVTLTNNLSNEIYNNDPEATENNPNSECNANCKSDTERHETEKEKKTP